MTTSNWYVLSVAAGAEQNAARKLSKITDNVAAPEQIIYRRRNNRLMAESRLLFPGYVFVQIAKLTAETYHLLKECPGVLRLLGKTGSAMPMPVPSEEMQVILGLYENYDRYLPAFRRNVCASEGPNTRCCWTQSAGRTVWRSQALSLRLWP